MQVASKQQPPNQPPVKIYNAVYSSVQVYECMIRGIAVMRRRADSYVNATQILKVAGIDKGRRTKILEKEILPGKHEIVQGGYGKYQGTWIPLERGRDIALQYGVAPLLSPLFDFQPSTNSLVTMPVTAPNITIAPRPLSAASSYSSLVGQPSSGSYSSLAPPPIMPGSALRLLNQGRAQGLFTPSTSSLGMHRPGYNSPVGLSGSPSLTTASQTPPPPSQNLKRHRSEADVESSTTPVDIQMADSSRPPSRFSQSNGSSGGNEGQSPAKRPRVEQATQEVAAPGYWHQPHPPAPPSRVVEGQTTISAPRPKSPPAPKPDRTPRMATKPSIPRNVDPTIPLKDTRRAATITAICQADDISTVVHLLRDIAPMARGSTPPDGLLYDIDTILDDQGHTALHIAASLSRFNIVQNLIKLGADVHRGNHLGETPLMRTILSTHSFEAQSLPALLSVGFSKTIMTLDTSKKSVLHHIVLLAGVKGRAIASRYYLDQIFKWIVKEDGGYFAKIVDLQDEHGDTALNIAARVGSRTLVRTLLDVGANRTLMNKLGLRPGDFGIETEELTAGAKADDAAAILRAGPSVPVQKAQDVVADMTTMIQSLSTEFQAEVKTKQDTLDVTQAHLRAATRELSEQRKQIQTWQNRCTELDMASQKARNLERAIQEEDYFDWTGRRKDTVENGLQPNGEDADGMVGVTSTAPTSSSLKQSSAFRYRGIASTFSSPANVMSYALDPDLVLPSGSDLGTLIRLRRMKLWLLRSEEMFEERMKGLQGATAEKEYMCRKIVALCTGLPIDQVDSKLESLVASIESESQGPEATRGGGFMQRIREG